MSESRYSSCQHGCPACRFPDLDNWPDTYERLLVSRAHQAHPGRDRDAMDAAGIADGMVIMMPGDPFLDP